MEQRSCSVSAGLKMKKTAVILDDDQIFAELLHKKIIELSVKYQLEFDVDIFTDKNAMEKSKKIYQLAFLDVVLPEKNGIDIAWEWKNCGRIRDVIFISAYEGEVFQIFESRPIYFVRKTHLDEDLERAIAAYQNRLKVSDVIIPEGAKYHVVNADEIVYLNSDNHYIDIHMENGKKLVLRGKMNDMEKILDTYSFVRIQVRYLINLKYVEMIGRQYLQLKTGEKYKISTRYREDLDKKLGLYFTGSVVEE